jgi:hypothetical protein
LEPAAGEMPEFLVGFDPDLIATGHGESVVVEVKAREDLEKWTSDRGDGSRITRSARVAVRARH